METSFSLKGIAYIRKLFLFLYIISEAAMQVYLHPHVQLTCDKK